MHPTVKHYRALLDFHSGFNDLDVLVSDSLTVSTEGRVDHHKLNHTEQ